jgi:hypothetical protein
MNAQETRLLDFCQKVKGNTPDLENRKGILDWIGQTSISLNSYDSCFKMVEEAIKNLTVQLEFAKEINSGILLAYRICLRRIS